MFNKFLYLQQLQKMNTFVINFLIIKEKRKEMVCPVF